MKDYQKEWRKKNPEYWKKWQKQSPEKMKQYRKTSYLKNKEKRNKESKDWRLKNPAYNLIRSAKIRCKNSGMEFNLDKSWAENKYTGYCELTGIAFDFSQIRGPYTASIDRIDNTKGYVKDNCRFILHALNMFKGIGTDDDMYIIAENLLITKDERNARRS